jgi:hypothetical protein
VGGWTAGRDPLEVHERLQHASACAHQFQQSRDCLADLNSPIATNSARSPPGARHRVSRRSARGVLTYPSRT